MKIKNLVFYFLWLLQLALLYLILHNHLIVFFIAIIIALVLMIIAVSQYGENILRFYYGVRPLKIYVERSRLKPLLDTVLSRPNSNQYKRVRLYIDDSAEVNGYSFGNRTIVITRGAIEMLDDNAIIGLIAHELSHIINGDTNTILLFTIGNGVFSIFYMFFLFIMRFVRYLINKSSNGEQLIYKMDLSMVILRIIEFVIGGFVGVYTCIMNLLLAIGKRKQELKADSSSYYLGFGNELYQLLLYFYSSQFSTGQSMKKRLLDSHPHIVDRIYQIEKLSGIAEGSTRHITVLDLKKGL